MALKLEKHEVCCGFFHGFDWSTWATGKPQERLSLLPLAQEHVLAEMDGKDRHLRTVCELSQASAPAVPHEDALRIRDDVGFFQDVRGTLAKHAPGEARAEEELDLALRQIISRGRVRGCNGHIRCRGAQVPDISVLPTSSWPRCATCRSETLRSSCCKSC